MSSIKAGLVRRTGIALIAAAGALACSFSANANEREVSRAGVEFSAPKYETVAEFAYAVTNGQPRGIEKPAISRAGVEYVAPKAAFGAIKDALTTGNGTEWSKVTRAGIEYVPPTVGGAAMKIGVVVPNGARGAASIEEIPYANRAGVVKHQPRYRNLAEFREAVLSATN
jgi:hypothetical protein